MTLEHQEQRGSTPPPITGGTGAVFPPRGASRNSETVINQERRAARESSVEQLPAPSSAICAVLFPPPDAVQQAFPNPAGVELGHFRIQNAIRSGGMGAVFEALDMRLNRTVALKILPPSQSRDLPSVQRFRNEAQAAAQLDHDNIARVYFIGEDQGLHFIAFEFIRGTNLREVVQQRGKLTPSEAVNYTLQVASAVAHASAHGVVHRDIKPSNIIITNSGRAKLVDLGLARSEHRENEPDLTVAGTTLGTFDYISPEQAKDPRSVDVRSDIYSLGCTLYHLLTGEPPYPQGTVLQKLLDHQGKDAPDPRLKNRRVTPELAAIVKMMMASDPRKRYQTAEELIRDLLVIASSLGLRSVSSEGLMWLSAQNSPDTFWERHASWLATAAGLLLIVAYLQFGLPQRERAENRIASHDDPFQDATANSINEAGTAASPNSAAARSGNSGRSDTAVLESTAQADDTNLLAANGKTAEAHLPDTDVIGGVAGKNLPSPVTPIPKSPSAGTLSDPGKVFDPPGGESFVESPLVVSKPRGVTNGPQEFSAENGTGNSSSPANQSVKKATIPNTLTTVEDPLDDILGSSTSETSVATVTPREPSRPTTEVTAQSSIVVMKSDGSPEQAFPTLEAACAVAQDGNVIELRFNGTRTESPLKIRNKITIRAGKGFRPVLEFVPKEIPAAGYETRMMTLSGGALDLVDVSLILNVKPSIAADAWVLISTQRAEAVRMQRVLVTVVNSARRPAAIMEFRGGSNRMVSDMEMMNAGQMTTPLTVRLADSMIRGGTDLFLTRTFLSARIDLDNCLLALDGTVLRALGTVDIPEKQTELALRLNQLTAALNAGLMVMEGGDAPRKFGRVSVEASNNIFTTVTSPEHQAAPLILMTSSEPAEDLLKLLAWNGQKNFYDGFESFWTRTAQDNSRTTSWDYDEWRFRWDSNEIDPHATIVLWKKPWSGRPFNELTPVDFALDDTATGNPALSAANNGGNAGVDLSRLEKLTTTTAPTTASARDSVISVGSMP